MTELNLQESGADDLQLGLQPGEPRLTPEDFDVALGRMKGERALMGLRRSLKDASLDASQILSIVRRILAIQAKEDESPARRRGCG